VKAFSAEYGAASRKYHESKTVEKQH